MFENNESKEQRASTTEQGITRMLACNEEKMKEQRSLSRQTPVLDLFKSPAGIRASTPALLDIGVMIQMTSYHPRAINEAKICLS